MKIRVNHQPSGGGEEKIVKMQGTKKLEDGTIYNEKYNSFKE